MSVSQTYKDLKRFLESETRVSHGRQPDIISVHSKTAGTNIAGGGVHESAPQNPHLGNFDED